MLMSCLMRNEDLMSSKEETRMKEETWTFRRMNVSGTRYKIHAPTAY